MTQKDHPLTDRLRELSATEPVRFHMPGHKGRAAHFEGVLDPSIAIDFTELSETDNLFAPAGVLLEAQQRAARAFGAAQTIFSAGGATLAIQACVCYAAKLAIQTGRPVYADRRCHLSVVNAFTLTDTQPEWFFPREEGLADRIRRQRPCACLITSPDYYGNFLLTDELARVCRSIGCILICDNSHGTHLAFYENGKHHALTMGADLVVDSAHKTLPALTGGAYLHIGGTLSRTGGELLSCMRLFGSTSPSYLIMSSLDSARGYMEKRGERELKRVRESIIKTREKLKEKGFTFEDEKQSDIFRLTIGCACIKIDGRKLYDFLAAKNIFCEFADQSRVICICTVADTREMYEKLTAAVCEFADKNRAERLDTGGVRAGGNGMGDPRTGGEKSNRRESGAGCAVDIRAHIPKRAISFRQAGFSRTAETPLSLATGKISAQLYAPYPPGIPLIMPGEVFDQIVIDALRGHVDIVKTIG